MMGGGARAARVAATLALAAAVVLPGAPVRADSCAGVTAVVDFGALGGGVQQRCVADGAGRPAWDVFEEAGFSLTPVQPYGDNAVCRISGKPASDPCSRMPPANAYWGLFWSSGSGWVYSTTAVGSLAVAAGGSLGFAWQSSTAQRAPGGAATSPRPMPTKKATARTTAKPLAKPGPAVTSAPPSLTRSASAASATTPQPSPSASVTTTASAPPGTTTEAAPTASVTPTASAAGPLAARNTADESGGGLPWWVPVLVVLAVLGGAGGAWWRRRASG